MLCEATCPPPAGGGGRHLSAVLFKGRTFAPFAPDFGVFRSPEEIRSLGAVLTGFLESSLSNLNDPNQNPLGEPRLSSEKIPGRGKESWASSAWNQIEPML